jgi:hypothetical protein
MRARIREWVWRYLPAELVSIVGTLLPAWILASEDASRVSIALAGTWGGNVGYFGTILLRDVIRNRRGLRLNGHRYTPRHFIRNLRDLVIEFGVAEILDSLLIRPALMYWLPLRLHSLTWGLVLAKGLADLTFYIPAIYFYEWNRRRKGRNGCE